MAKEDAGREAFLQEAGKLYDQLISRAGPQTGDTFDDIEEQAEGAGRKLILQMLRERLEAEAKAQPKETICSTCGKPMRTSKNDAPRNLDTASGVVHYERPHAICDRCRASFSPSGRAAENSAARGFGAPAAKGMRGKPRRFI